MAATFSQFPATFRDMPLKTDLFICQARESSLVPAGFLTAQFLKANTIYEACVVMGVFVGVYLHRLHGGSKKWIYLCSSSFLASIHIPFPLEIE